MDSITMFAMRNEIEKIALSAGSVRMLGGGALGGLAGGAMATDENKGLGVLGGAAAGAIGGRLGGAALQGRSIRKTVGQGAADKATIGSVKQNVANVKEQVIPGAKWSQLREGKVQMPGAGKATYAPGSADGKIKAVGTPGSKRGFRERVKNFVGRGKSTDSTAPVA